MKRQMEVEGESLEICRTKAAKSLGLPPEDVRLTVLRQGKKGIIWNTSFRVRVSCKDQQNNHEEQKEQNPRLSGLDLRMSMIDEELQNMNLTDENQIHETYDKMLQNYDSLSPERREEVKALSSILSGPEADKTQERISRNGTFEVRVASDKLTVYLAVFPPEGLGSPVKLHEVLNYLRDQGLVQGVDHVKIRRVLEDVLDVAKPLKDVEIAHGAAPVDGNDGYVEYYVMPPSKETVVRDDGSVDWHGKARVNALKIGERLARFVPPGPGEAGVNVYGTSIPSCAGKNAQLEPGPNVVFNKERLEFTTEIDGIMELKGTTLSVRPVYVVLGDVGMESGSVEFDGAVEVTGSVQSGFYVRATGNITIQGNVEAAEIVSRTGDVVVKKGIAGKSRCFVSAYGDVKTKYIENATIYARHNIEVGSAILHSSITAGNAVIAMTGRGSIMGGAVRAGELVQAKHLGGESEPHTAITVGIDIDEHEHLADIDRQVVSLQNVAIHIEEVTKAIECKGKAISQLSRSDKEKLKSLKMKLLVIHNEIDSLNQERGQFLGEVVAMARGSVNVASEAYGKVEIHIGPLVEVLKSRISSVTFCIQDNEERIAQEPFSDGTKKLE